MMNQIKKFSLFCLLSLPTVVAWAIDKPVPEPEETQSSTAQTLLNHKTDRFGGIIIDITIYEIILQSAYIIRLLSEKEGKRGVWLPSLLSTASLFLLQSRKGLSIIMPYRIK